MPVVLEVFRIAAKKGFQGLDRSLGLTVGALVESRGGRVLDVKEFTKMGEKHVNELCTAV